MSSLKVMRTMFSHQPLISGTIVYSQKGIHSWVSVTLVLFPNNLVQRLDQCFVAPTSLALCIRLAVQSITAQYWWARISVNADDFLLLLRRKHCLTLRVADTFRTVTLPHPSPNHDQLLVALTEVLGHLFTIDISINYHARFCLARSCILTMINI